MKNILSLFFILFSITLVAQTGLSNQFSKSYAHETKGEYGLAIKSIMPIQSNFAYEQHLRLGWLYYLKQDYSNSEKNYNKAIAISDHSIEAWFGIVYPQAAMNNWAGVIISYENILSIAPNNNTALYRLATLYNDQKDFKKAQQHIELLCSLYPFDYDSNLLAGTIHVSLGMIKEAKIYFQKAMLYNPSSTDASAALSKI